MVGKNRSAQSKDTIIMFDNTFNCYGTIAYTNYVLLKYLLKTQKRRNSCFSDAQSATNTKHCFFFVAFSIKLKKIETISGPEHHSFLSFFWFFEFFSKKLLELVYPSQTIFLKRKKKT